MSEPSASGTIPDASAHAAPPDEPPADRVGSTGLRVVPKTLLNVCEPAANSGTLVLPITTTPARRTRSTISSSASGTWSAKSGEPYVVRQPATAWVSLNANGSPCSGPTSAPDASASSAAAAPARARSSSSETIALSSGLRSAIRARCRSSSSRAEISGAYGGRLVARGRVDRDAHRRRRPKSPPTTTPSRTSPAPTTMPLRKSSCDELPTGLRRGGEDGCGRRLAGGGLDGVDHRRSRALTDRLGDVAEELAGHPLRDAGQHPLADAADHAADDRVGLVVDLGAPGAASPKQTWTVASMVPGAPAPEAASPATRAPRGRRARRSPGRCP